MGTTSQSTLLAGLQQPAAYPHGVDGPVELIETHISWVLLAGEFAYKIKKPIRNHFLDYSTLELRKLCCERELRLNRRFAAELYLGVVGITQSDEGLRVESVGKTGSETIEFAVKMKRFASDALLKDRLKSGTMEILQVRQLAASIAKFHLEAASAEGSSPFGSPEVLYEEALDNCRDLVQANVAGTLDSIEWLEQWTRRQFETHRAAWAERKAAGHIRECHGDLHLGNVVWSRGEWIPFDGIEFSDKFRWIDTLSDAAFTAMDFAANGRWDFCHSFINAYLEATGDYGAVNVLQWYLVYRAMVRAKVAALRSAQLPAGSEEHVAAELELNNLLVLANLLAAEPRASAELWITHGVSGSGKTSGSEQVVQRHGGVRLRADVERKRLVAMQSIASGRVIPKASALDRGTSESLYSAEMTEATYQRLAELAEALLRSGVSVIVDATCLKRAQRDLFHDVAKRLKVRFRILVFHADYAVLRERILARMRAGLDASDANPDVLDLQLAHMEPLGAEELAFVSSVTE